MYLKWYLDENNQRIYTMKKYDPTGRPTFSAHPARFSPANSYSAERIRIKRRFNALPMQQEASEPKD